MLKKGPKIAKKYIFTVRANTPLPILQKKGKKYQKFFEKSQVLYKTPRRQRFFDITF